MASTQANFAPDASTGTSFGSTSSTVALPGTPASDSMVRVCNLGPCHIAVKLGTASNIPVTSSNGMMILAGETVYLTLGANTFLGGVSAGGPSSASTVNITTGN
jgi:hypothetical protein